MWERYLMYDLISFYIGINMLSLFMVIILIGEGANFSFVNPLVIYKSIKVNWFGAILLSIICNIMLPLISIPYWIYKSCTIGRE